MHVYLPVDIAIPSPPPAPAPSRFRHVESHPFRSLWPKEPSTDVSLLDNSRRCPHQDVFPCLCRNNTDRRGLACQRCSFQQCSVDCLLQRGSVEELDCALQAELACERCRQHFEEELRSATNAARLREVDPADDAEQHCIPHAGLFELESLDFASANRQRANSPNDADVESSD
ncbi:hypothetical protein CSPAE12_08420 [Colletotrichum incanum]|nr:hypothetical protein CSPAE12_08420 [Colletotrichum incanum]